MRHYDGLYWSSTTRCHLAYESLMERDRFLWVDFDPDVEWISAQPMALLIPTDERLLKRIPDILLRRTDGSLLVVDVKTALVSVQALRSAATQVQRCLLVALDVKTARFWERALTP
ncbi:hypothetical protein [Cellulomonas terrae]|uniref:TnsA endonuclease N-terminal domain-containing protein n=1 Tax=Cellulomonas terrae TaxID=311234 RepID=A0A511JLZ9_9CELL|nr:hypothetical protein [Cellulomonas terrae]GEL99008.1 hypothetical protein CTE05_25550 [Cellulomonas terrae]